MPAVTTPTMRTRFETHMYGLFCFGDRRQSRQQTARSAWPGRCVDVLLLAMAACVAGMLYDIHHFDPIAHIVGESVPIPRPTSNRAHRELAHLERVSSEYANRHRYVERALQCAGNFSVVATEYEPTRELWATAHWSEFAFDASDYQSYLDPVEFLFQRFKLAQRISDMDMSLLDCYK